MVRWLQELQQDGRIDHLITDVMAIAILYLTFEYYIEPTWDIWTYTPNEEKGRALLLVSVLYFVIHFFGYITNRIQPHQFGDAFSIIDLTLLAHWTEYLGRLGGIHYNPVVALLFGVPFGFVIHRIYIHRANPQLQRNFLTRLLLIGFAYFAAINSVFAGEILWLFTIASLPWEFYGLNVFGTLLVSFILYQGSKVGESDADGQL
jgi:hypothetical protein